MVIKYPDELRGKLFDKLYNMGAITEYTEESNIPSASEMIKKGLLLYTVVDGSGSRVHILKGYHYVNRLFQWYVIDTSKVK